MQEGNRIMEFSVVLKDAFQVSGVIKVQEYKIFCALFFGKEIFNAFQKFEIKYLIHRN